MLLKDNENIPLAKGSFKPDKNLLLSDYPNSVPGNC